ncbi:MAG: hypothetical protein ACKOAG_12350 [Candidatus Kapaibacterium sp.]
MRFSLLLLFLTCTIANAQWTRVRLDPQYDYLPAKQVLVDGSTIYVGSSGLLFRSTDGATTFTRCQKGLLDALSGVTGLV